MRRILPVLAALCVSAAALADPPINGNAPPPGFVPPQLKGLKGDGVARRADGPIPLPAADEEWIEARSKHFVFVSAAGEKKTKQMAENLETLAASLMRLNATFDVARPERTRIFLFTKRREAQAYFDMLLNRRDATVSGIFVTQNSGASIVMLTGFRSATDRTAFHELVHNLVESRANPPLWLDEGMAEYFSNVELRNGSMYAGEPIPRHIEALRRHADLPLKTLFSVVRESDTYNLPEGQSLFYAESWATVDWLMRNAGEDRAAFYAFFTDVSSGTPVDVALKTRYGKSINDLQAAIAAYGALSRPAFGMTIKVPEADTSVEIRPLSRPSTLVAFGRFLAGLEEMALDAERHFRAALDVDPHDAPALAAIAVLRANAKRWDDATKLFEQALGADADDPGILLDDAEALLREQIGAVAETDDVSMDDVSRFRKARTLAEKALTLGGDAGRAWGDIGTSWLVEDDSALGPGIAALEKAHTLLPGRNDFALHLLAMLRRTRDLAKADALFAVLDASRNAQVAYVARAIVTRVEMNRANEFSREGKLEDAAAILRELAEKTPDPNGRRDLETQAGELLRVAATNKQIEVYNGAVAQVNKGKYSVARKMLAGILAEANDADLIRDVKNLQKQLEGRKDLR